MLRSLLRKPRAAPVNGRSGRAAEERVVNAIVQAIHEHRLLPGMRLAEREVAELLDVSRATVRAALARLGHSLLVELRPNRGAVVANPSIDETRHLFEARRVMESAIVHRLAQNMTREKRDRLRAFVAEEQQAYDRGDTLAGQRLSIDFHRVISELAGNAVFDRFMGELIARTPLLALAHQGARRAYCGAHEHRAVVEAMIEGKGQRAAELMSAHLNTLESQLKLEEPTAPPTLAQALRAGRSPRKAGRNGAARPYA
jgi:DNA-binding GntR family transcriptional regulator